MLLWDKKERKRRRRRTPLKADTSACGSNRFTLFEYLPWRRSWQSDEQPSRQHKNKELRRWVDAPLRDLVEANRRLTYATTLRYTSVRTSKWRHVTCVYLMNLFALFHFFVEACRRQVLSRQPQTLLRFLRARNGD